MGRALARLVLAGALLAFPAAANEAGPAASFEPHFANAPAKGAKECGCQRKHLSPGRAAEYYRRALGYLETDPKKALLWARVALQFDPGHNDARRLRDKLEMQGVSLKD